MQAIILAAGMGKRLKELTDNNTKCMIKVNGVTLIERMLSQLDKFNLTTINIVVGYKGDELKEYIESLEINTPIKYITNDIYYKTNNIYSLYLAKECLLEEDTILLESDLIFEDAVLERIIKDPYPSLALVAKYESWMDGTVVTLDENNNILNFLDKKHFSFDDIKKYFKTVNIYKFSKEFSNSHYVPFLKAYCSALGNNEYYEQVLKVITLLDRPEIKASILSDEAWYEIDDIQDLDIAESIFTTSLEDKISKMQKRYGGYWRYPGLIDFCYLVNPFYPSTKLLDEIKANFERLMCEYPSGMNVNCLLAAKYFGVNINEIVIGNGAAELINALMNDINGKVGIVQPTFEEYPNRLKCENVVVFNPSNRDFRYDADDLINYYEKKDISVLLLINPDNPSGNYILKSDVLKVAKWAKKKNIMFIVDESFVDFVDKEEDTSLISSEVIHEYENLVIIKSISKSFGVPGIRLGVLVSSNIKLIGKIKSSVSIWNINSFGEFYMQICEKYKGDYVEALKKFKEVRKDYLESLSKIEGLRVIPSQANYITCELINGKKSSDLSKDLLDRYNILIKDLSQKKGIWGEYIRLAVKLPEENKKIVYALNELLNNR